MYRIICQSPKERNEKSLQHLGLVVEVVASYQTNLVLSTGYISGGIVDAIPNGKSSKGAFEAERGMCGDGSSKSDLKQSDVACDVTLRNLIPSYSRKLKLIKSSPYIATSYAVESRIYN